MNNEKWIVDTDPGCDDMMALLYLLKRHDVELLMISLVDGNVSLDMVSQNSRKILKLAGKKIPLHRGTSFPIIKEFANEESYHYCDGLGDIDEIKNYNANDIEIAEKNSVIKIVEYVEKYPKDVNILCLGPLTNIAIAYMLNPSIIHKIKNIYMMGGSTLSKGNILPPSEFNFAYDFISSKIVITKFYNIILTPWEPTSELYIRDHTLKQLYDRIKGKKKLLNEIIFYFVSLIISKYTKDKNGTQLCDLYTVISAFERSCITKFSICQCDIVIDTKGMLGMLFIKAQKPSSINFQTFFHDKDNWENKKGTHIIIDELDELTILQQYEKVFYL